MNLIHFQNSKLTEYSWSLISGNVPNWFLSTIHTITYYSLWYLHGLLLVWRTYSYIFFKIVPAQEAQYFTVLSQTEDYQRKRSILQYEPREAVITALWKCQWVPSFHAGVENMIYISFEKLTLTATCKVALLSISLFKQMNKTCLFVYKCHNDFKTAF